MIASLIVIAIAAKALVKVQKELNRTRQELIKLNQKTI